MFYLDLWTITYFRKSQWSNQFLLETKWTIVIQLKKKLLRGPWDITLQTWKRNASLLAVHTILDMNLHTLKLLKTIPSGHPAAKIYGILSEHNITSNGHTITHPAAQLPTQIKITSIFSADLLSFSPGWGINHIHKSLVLSGFKTCAIDFSSVTSKDTEPGKRVYKVVTWCVSWNEAFNNLCFWIKISNICLSFPINIFQWKFTKQDLHALNNHDKWKKDSNILFSCAATKPAPGRRIQFSSVRNCT